ncbi:hypothetical protein AUC69_09245 [Methyloceanibacter superfactus]|uniref:O-methyltransferase C-terminal domain-containing protein n=1 Tax=Methyloceanibacter superfactus TaxID=1774969 RepID=A0A1E3W1T7_9HYPH|nr:hypothetical protein AUC69_09245 [Methyloceanibacter superfactus]
MKSGARLVVIERLLPEHATDDPAAVMLDLHMMAITGGKARTESEIRALIGDAGLSPADLSATRTGLSLIAATRP